MTLGARPSVGQLVERDRFAAVELGPPYRQMALVQSLEHRRALPGAAPGERGLACHLLRRLHLDRARARPLGHPPGLGLDPLRHADRVPARGGGQARQGGAGTRQIGPGRMQVPYGDGQLLRRHPFLQLAHPEDRVEAEAVRLHETPPGCTRSSSAAVVAASELVSPTGWRVNASMAGRSSTARSTTGLVPGT